MLIIRGESGYIPVADYFDLSEESEVSTILIADCSNAELDFAGVRFADGSMGCHARALVEESESTDCTISNLNYQKEVYWSWNWQEWSNARDGVVLHSEGNGLKDCFLQGVGFGVRALSHQNHIRNLTVQGHATDALRITGNDFYGENISLGECYWNVSPECLCDAEHADGIHIHPLLPPEEQHKGVISGLKLKDVIIHNRQDFNTQRWMHGLQLTDGQLHNSRLENVRIETDNSNGLVIAEAHNLELEDVHVHSPNPEEVESQICIGTRKPNYNKSSNVWTRRVTADRWGIV